MNSIKTMSIRASKTNGKNYVMKQAVNEMKCISLFRSCRVYLILRAAVVQPVNNVVMRFVRLPFINHATVLWISGIVADYLCVTFHLSAKF